MVQKKFNAEPEAEFAAESLSVEKGYAAVILSKGIYFVESEPPLVRNFEKLICEYEEGKKINY